jgi:hypothetical protein
MGEETPDKIIKAICASATSGGCIAEGEGCIAEEKEGLITQIVTNCNF